MKRATSWSLAAPVAALALALVACGDDDGGETTTATNAATEAGCEAVQTPAPKDVELERPTARVQPGKSLTAVVETSCGAFEIALDSRTSPKTASSFVHMAKKGVYEQTTFHRIVPGFVIQGGDPTGTDDGDAGYFIDEPPPQDTEYTRGTVAMGKGPVDPPGRSGRASSSWSPPPTRESRPISQFSAGFGGARTWSRELAGSAIRPAARRGFRWRRW